MWTLIKAGFWFTIILIILPFFAPEHLKQDQGATSVEMDGSMSAALAVYQDVTAMCDRNPQICDVGFQTITFLGHRAKEGARIAYHYLDETFGEEAQPNATPSPDELNPFPIKTASVPVE